MKANLKLAVVAVALTGLSLGAATPVAAQTTGQGGCNMPEASLCYWPQNPTESMVAGVMIPVEYTWLGQPILPHAAVHVNGAEQLIQAGQTFVPEASLYRNDSPQQESGASQLKRIYGPNAFIPEAALYLGEWMPRAATAAAQ